MCIINGWSPTSSSEPESEFRRGLTDLFGASHIAIVCLHKHSHRMSTTDNESLMTACPILQHHGADYSKYIYRTKFYVNAYQRARTGNTGGKDKRRAEESRGGGDEENLDENVMRT